ncbi:uncharacterized protein LOC118195798 [Stegodyphus dumicola]|uniref:uncharacterized protein LOC118195798 n=1 Tax=Stegodyphus dumicola TaxID=202533 RepID=UPI0015AE69AB|nr:uncharacterized protein LOC118195798 [Stegodyphus dumicola]
MKSCIRLLVDVTLFVTLMFIQGNASYSEFSYAQKTHNEIIKAGSKNQAPEYRETRVRTKYYELTKEDFAQMSDEGYGKMNRGRHSRGQRKKTQKSLFREQQKCKTFHCVCDSENKQGTEMCCYEIKPASTKSGRSIKNVAHDFPDDYDDNVLNDVSIQPNRNDKSCHRGAKHFSHPSPRMRKPKDRLNVLIIGDETVDFLKGSIYRGRCNVSTESYPGLSVTDAKQRMRDALAKMDDKPDKLIIHAGANDIIDELPSVSSLVISKLKGLVDEMRSSQESGNAARSYALSGIIPRNDPLMTYNHKVNVINSDVGWYAQRNGVEYIDHSHVFWENGALRKDLYHFDGTLNEDGLRLVEDSIFDDSWCRRTDDDFHEQTWNLRQKIRMRNRPSLELKDILPMERKVYDKHLPPKKDGQPTKVHFHVTVLSVDSIDEESMTYVADIFLAQSWQDYRLRLPENMTEGYRILDVGWLQYIWRPDSFFKNAKKVTFHDMSVPNHYLWLYYDKTLLYMAKLTLELSCAMKFEAYPHDTQNCSMMIESSGDLRKMRLNTKVSYPYRSLIEVFVLGRLATSGGEL